MNLYSNDGTSGKNAPLKLAHCISFLLCLLSISTEAIGCEDALDITIKNALETNPTLQAAREFVREADSNLATARTGRNPKLKVEAERGIARTYQRSPSGQVGLGASVGQPITTQPRASASAFEIRQKVRPKTEKAIIEQPLYKGGSIKANIDGADYKLCSAKWRLASIQNTLIHDVVRVYLDVVIAENQILLHKKTEHVLGQYLGSANLNFKMGGNSRTDVAQAESRLAGAKADRLQAESNLKAAEANFEKLVGYRPLNLTFPTLKLHLPTSLQDALQIAECHNPEIAQIRADESASVANVRQVKGELYPTLSLRGEAVQLEDQFFKNIKTRTSGVYATLSIPLYSSGSTATRLEAARHQQKQKLYAVQEKLSEIRAKVTAAFDDVRTQKAKIEARLAEVKAADLALQGLRIEQKNGGRSFLDLLDGEKEALAANLNYNTAKADYIDATYGLMSLLGELQ